jgi:hypothetical protein
MRSSLLRNACVAVIALSACVGAANAQPLNDSCLNATQIASGSVVRFDSTFANNDAPAACGTNSYGVWFRYTAPAGGGVHVITCGSSFDTVLSVWTGTCGSPALVVCNDDACGLQSDVTFTATAGTSYLIRVEAFASRLGAQGILTLIDNSPSTAAFTFQGQLTSSGSPVASADLSFRLFDMPAGGTQVGPTITRSNVTLINGTTSQLLDFGQGAFNGGGRWLEVSAASPPGGPATTLSPRQPVSRAPYANRADSAYFSEHAVTSNNATAALTATNADTAGLAASVPWTGIVGMPADFADGVDDTVALAGTGTAVTASHSDHFHSKLSTPNGSDLNAIAVNSAGNVGVGLGGVLPDARIHASAAGRVLKVDRLGTDGELLAWARDDGVVGSVTASGGVVTYGAFTGVHYARLDPSDTARPGELVRMTGDNTTLALRPDGEVVYGIVATARANDPAALGVLMSTLPGKDFKHPDDIAQVASVGNGDMWVVDTDPHHRDINPGDLLIASAERGCAMLDDAGIYPLGNIVARAAAKVRWADIPPGEDGLRRARVSVLFDRFTRAGDPRRASEEVASLRSRIERLEAALERGAGE